MTVAWNSLKILWPKFQRHLVSLSVHGMNISIQICSCNSVVTFYHSMPQKHNASFSVFLNILASSILSHLFVLLTCLCSLWRADQSGRCSVVVIVVFASDRRYTQRWFLSRCRSFYCYTEVTLSSLNPLQTSVQHLCLRLGLDCSFLALSSSSLGLTRNWGLYILFILLVYAQCINCNVSLNRESIQHLALVIAQAVNIDQSCNIPHHLHPPSKPLMTFNSHWICNSHT